ncbi:MAG: hypothetical protein U1E51_12720 [Candidatus Binatia bacterium]|nr:hypothetical protein [Candidatus Binatia bacterium]
MTVTPTSTATPTITATPTPEIKEKGLKVRKTDNVDVARPGQTITYGIEVENTGDIDIFDVEIEDTVSSYLHIIDVSPDASERDGQTVRWEGIEVGAGDKKTFHITAKVDDNTPNGTVIGNKVYVKSEDYDIDTYAEDITVIERQPRIAAITVVPITPYSPTGVPITAKTGAGWLGLFSALAGSGGLALISRKPW